MAKEYADTMTNIEDPDQTLLGAKQSDFGLHSLPIPAFLKSSKIHSFSCLSR